MAPEIAGSSAWLCRHKEAHVACAAAIAPSRFEVDRCPVNIADWHDARRIACFPSGDMLPEATQKRWIV